MLRPVPTAFTRLRPRPVSMTLALAGFCAMAAASPAGATASAVTLARPAGQDVAAQAGERVLEGRIREERLRVEVYPLGASVFVSYRLDVDLAIQEVPFVAPDAEGLSRYSIEANAASRPATVTMDPDGSPRTGRVGLPPDRRDRAVTVVLRYQLNVELDEADEISRIGTRVPVAYIPVPPGERRPPVGGAETQIRLPAGFRLAETDPGGFTPETVVDDNRPLYRRTSDTLPRWLEVRALEDFGQPPVGAVRTPWLLAGLLLGGMLLWLVVRRRGRPERT